MYLKEIAEKLKSFSSHPFVRCKDRSFIPRVKENRMILKGLGCLNEHRGIPISTPIGFSTKQANDVNHEFPLLALFREKEDALIKRARAPEARWKHRGRALEEDGIF